MLRNHLLSAAGAAALTLGLATQASAMIQLQYSPNPAATSDISSSSATGSNSQLTSPGTGELAEYGSNGSWSGLANTACSTGGPVAPPCTYVVASDVNYTPGADQGTLSMDLTFLGQLPSGNLDLTITLANATFGTTFSPTAVTFPSGSCASATVGTSLGGGSGDSSVKFLVSNSSGGCNGVIHLEIPVNIGTGLGSTKSNVTVTANLVTDGFGTPVDGGTAVYTNALTFLDALAEGSLTELRDNGQNTYASLLDYRVLGPDHKLGDVWANVKTYAHYNLSNTAFVDGDLNSAVLTVTGGFASIGPALWQDTDPGATGGLNQCNVDASMTFCTATASGSGSWLYDVGLTTLAENPVIQPSAYSASISAQLNHSIYQSTPLVTGNLPLNPLGRQGAFIIVPWTASAAMAGTTGSDNTIRVSNVGQSATGPVLLEVLASTCHPANSTSPCTGTDPVGKAPLQLVSSIPPGGEFLIDDAESGTIASEIGEYGRADLKITVVADPRTVTVKKEIVKNGNISDQALGSMADGQVGGMLIGEQNIAPSYFQWNNGPVNPTASPVPGSTAPDQQGTSGNPLNPQNTSGIPLISFVPNSVSGTQTSFGNGPNTPTDTGVLPPF